MHGMPLSPASHCLAALPATMSAFNSTAATGFSTKSVDSQKNSRDLKQLHYIQKFYDEFCSFTWNDLVIYFITTKPLHHLQVC